MGNQKGEIDVWRASGRGARCRTGIGVPLRRSERNR